MDPQKRAERLKILLAKLGLNGASFAELAGLLRQQTARWLAGNSPWQGHQSIRRAAASLGMTSDEFEDYLDGADDRMPLDEAHRRAKPAVQSARDRLEQRKAVSKRVRLRAAKYEEDTGEQVIEGLEEFAGSVVWRLAGAKPSDAYIERAVAFLQDAMADVKRRADQELKPPSDSPPHQRRTDTNRKLKRH